MNVDRVYNTVKEVFTDTSNIRDEYIIYLVGFEGLYILIENDLLEPREVIDGRQLYALSDRE